MNKKYLSFIFISFLSLGLCAQSNKLDKKMEKAYALADKGKLDEAAEKTEEILEENPEYGKAWDFLGEVRLAQYKEAKRLDKIEGNITVTSKDKNGKEDSLTTALAAMLKSFSPSKIAWNKYLYTMRKALLTSQDAYHASFILRNYFVDIEIDTAVSKKALKHFNNAEEEFGKKNYAEAAVLYKRAIEEQPDFYKASLYMGDCFFFTGNYINAINSFKTAKEKFPMLVEPRKYLIDAYAKERLYKNAFEESILAMSVYPDLSLIAKLEDAAYYNQKNIDIKWTARQVFPNQVKNEKRKTDINTYEDKKEKEAKEPWTFYQTALTNIKTYCDTNGVITKSNSFTKAKYLEVYSWEEMLKNSQDPSLEEARRMQKDGFLDCYVLVSCFHFDLYSQYKDFVTKNKNRVTEYYNKYTVNRN